MELKPLYIYGSSGAASYVAWTVDLINEVEPTYDFLGYIDDRPHAQGRVFQGLPVISFEAAVRQSPGAYLIAAIGTGSDRRMLVEKSAKAGFKFPTLVDPGSRVSKWSEVGEGTVVVLGELIGPQIKIGKHVHITGGYGTLGHHITVGDYCTFGAGVHVAGHVNIGQNVFFGVGARVINGTEDEPLTIADDVFIGAGTLVTKSVTTPGCSVVGVPGRQFSRSD